MDMVGVTSRSNSVSNRATICRAIRCSSASELAKVRLSTVLAISWAARLWGSTWSQSMPSISLSPALITLRKGTSPDGSNTSASSLDTWWPAASRRRPARSTAATGSSATGRPSADTVHRATRSRPGSAPTSSANGTVGPRRIEPRVRVGDADDIEDGGGVGHRAG